MTRQDSVSFLEICLHDYRVGVVAGYRSGKNVLNLHRKEWFKVTMEYFELQAAKADIPWRAIKPHLFDTLDKARTLWQKELANLPMDDEHKRGLQEHWQNLHSDFRV